MLDTHKMPVFRYRISGLVQGVFFRASAKDKAQALNLRGWVRNLPDGDVETVAGGAAESLHAFAAWLRHGPKQARVKNIETTDISAETDAGGLPYPFEIQD